MAWKTNAQVSRELNKLTGYKPSKPKKLDYDDFDLIKILSQSNGTLINYIRKSKFQIGSAQARDVLSFDGSVPTWVDGDSITYCEATYEVISDG